MPIRQFKKENNLWFEKFVNLDNKKKPFYFYKKTNIKNVDKNFGFMISKNQDFIEYSEQGFCYIKDLSRIIKKNSGGLLLIDYGYLEKKMKNTLKGYKDHKFANILDNIGNVDITHDISFDLFRNLIKKIGGLKNNLTSQKNFLIKMGIEQRAEIISRNQNFSKKADIYYRLKKLIDEKQMGNIFKVMLIKNKKNKFNLGFEK